jgi:hypothetical protein
MNEIHHYSGRSKVLYMADYESLRRERAPVPMPGVLYWVWLLGICAWTYALCGKRV